MRVRIVCQTGVYWALAFALLEYAHVEKCMLNYQAVKFLFFPIFLDIPIFFPYFSEKFLFFPIFLDFERLWGLDIKFNNCKMAFLRK